MFYADDGQISGRVHIWVQETLTMTVAIFRRVGIDTNLGNTMSLVCTPGYIWGKWSEEVYKSRATGEGETFSKNK